MNKVNLAFSYNPNTNYHRLPHLLYIYGSSIKVQICKRQNVLYSIYNIGGTVKKIDFNFLKVEFRS